MKSVIKTKSGTLICFCNSCDGLEFKEEEKKHHSEFNIGVTNVPGINRHILVCLPKFLRKLDVDPIDFMITYFDKPNDRIDAELISILEKEEMAHA